MKKALFITLLLCGWLFAEGTAHRTRLSYTAWFEQLKNSTASELIFSDCEFYDDTTAGKSASSFHGEITVNSALTLKNVLFDGSVISDIIFTKPVVFEEIDGNVYWSRCSFKSVLRFNKISGDVWFDTTLFNGLIWEPDEKADDAFMRFNQCNFYSGAFYKAEYKDYAITSPMIIIGNCFKATRLEIANSVFHNNNRDAVLLISYTDFLNVTLANNRFDTRVSFLNSVIYNSFEVVRCDFRCPIDFSGFTFPNPDTHLKFAQIQGKIQLAQDIENLPGGNWYSGKNVTEVSDTLQFYRLVATYYKLMSVYKARGDFESANACYIDIKNLELMKLKFEFNAHPSLNLWFGYGLNYFLRWFSDYGTNPSKALVFSFYTLLLFAGIYFFFPSQFSTLDSFSLIKRIRWLINYISSDNRLIDLYEKDEERVTKENFMKEFEQLLHLKEKEIPFFIKVVAHPINALSRIPDRIGRWFLTKSDFASGKWSNFSERQKVMLGTLLAFGMFMYMLQILLIRCLSSLLLSLNVFSTLGFGAIPVTGFPRYLAILQGFIGWFFLSIFSASLISQLLQ